MKLTILTLLSALAQAQTITLTGPPSVRIGETVTVDVSSSTPGVAAYQWALSLPVNWTVVSKAGAVSTKQLYCNPAGLLCLLVGAAPPNLDIIPAGKLASITLRVPAGTALGAAAIGLTGTFAASPNATNIPVTGVGMTVTVLNPKYDISGDGVVTSADVSTIAQMVADGGSCSFDGPSVPCKLVDVIYAAMAALGL